MNGQEKIQNFLKAPAFGVVGASDNPDKFGYKVYKTYLRHGMKAYPVGRVKEIEGNAVYENIAKLPEKVESISVITPPAVTDQVVDDAITAGVKNIWMQPGAESDAAIKKAEAAGINVIHGGPCILIELG
ncbi:MAG TPA: CoA-binding protein [Candidatus Obscuribacterales bacterium]